MVVQLMGSEGSTSGVAEEPTAVPGVRAFVLASALLRCAFFSYLAVVTLSALGLAPLASGALAWALLLVALGGGVARLRGGRIHAAPADRTALGRVGQVAMVAGLTATALSAALALALPIGAYDALGYRLAAVAQWLDAGAVVWVEGDDPLRNGYPLGLEVIEALLFRAMGSAAAVDAVSTVFVLAGGLALAGLARTLGAPRWAAQLSLGLFLLVPMQLLNAPSGYADAAFAGALVALLMLSARWAASPHARAESWLDLGMAAALVIALKPHGFALAAIALAAGMLGRTLRVALRPALGELAKIALVATSGLFFALRNVVVTGNPIYPLELRIGERVLLAGEASLDGILTPTFNVPPELLRLPSFLRPAWVWLQPHGPARSFDDRLAGFGYAFMLVGIPALIWAVLRVRDARQPRALAYVVGATAACFVAQPLAFWPRFTSWLWGAAALALALWLAALVRDGHTRLALGLAVASLAAAIPEAGFALAHVKRIDAHGLSLLGEDHVTQLARVSGLDAGFVRRALLHKRDVCRTPWRLGTDDANLDGIVAQLSPRPRMHVVTEESWSKLPAAVRARGCDALIVIGESPLIAAAPRAYASRIARTTAFGPCHLVSLSSPEVSP
ncbi:MAG: hypothetical protein ABW252_05270 [Polyangiales bacterium]